MIDPTERHPVYWMNQRRLSGNGAIIAQIEDFYEHVMAHDHKAQIRARKLVALNNILTNLLLGAAYQLPIAHYRDHNIYYRIPCRYGMQHFTYAQVVPQLRELERLGLITNDLGEQVQEVGYAVVSEMKAVEGLWEHFTPDVTEGWGTISVMFNDPIQLKAKKNKHGVKKLLKYDDNEQIREWRSMIEEYNRFISTVQVAREAPEDGPSVTPPVVPPSFSTNRQTFLLRAPDTGFLDCRLYRVWNNGSWERGGRFYGAEYQQLNEEERTRLLIDGNSVVELDYSGLHIRMLYHLEGIDYQDDPYRAVAADETSRKLLKQVCIVGLNTKSREQTINTIEHDPDYDFHIRHSSLPLRVLVKRFEKVHSGISMHLYKEKGLKLQAIDSQIASDILAHFTAQNIPCLCVHDSFIVKQHNQDELRQVMTDVYKEHVNGFEPVIK